MTHYMRKYLIILVMQFQILEVFNSGIFTPLTHFYKYSPTLRSSGKTPSYITLLPTDVQAVTDFVISSFEAEHLH
jgi:hypothetical protein